MSIILDKAIIALSEYFGRMDEHDKQRNVLQNHLDTIVKETTELEADIETLHTDMNTIVPELHNEIDKVKAERDEFASALHKYKNTIMPTLNEEIERLTKDRDAWKATATRAVNSILRSGTVCEFCQHNPSDCIGTPCPDVSLKDALTHFGAPEEDA